MPLTLSAEEMTFTPPEAERFCMASTEPSPAYGRHYQEERHSLGLGLSPTPQQLKTETHTLLHCPPAASLWQRDTNCFSYNPITPTDTWRTILERGKSSSPYIKDLWVAMVFSICSNVWNARNKWHSDGFKIAIHKIMLNILMNIADAAHLSQHTMNNTVHDLKIIKTLNVQCKPRKHSNIESCRWLLPKANEVKIYCDGSVMGNPGPAGIGMMYKNNTGEVLGTFSKSIGQATNYIAEITTIISGVQRVVARGWRRVWVVSDSAAAIKVFLKDSIPWKKSLDNWIYPMKYGLTGQFLPWKLRNLDGFVAMVERFAGELHIEKAPEVTHFGGESFPEDIYSPIAETGGAFFVVYDLLPNGSLDTWIFPRTGDACIQFVSWKLRYKVVVDVARALVYLHHDYQGRAYQGRLYKFIYIFGPFFGGPCVVAHVAHPHGRAWCILHLDIKPENILLDDDLQAVVSDFGLSKLMNKDKSEVHTKMIRGTAGYMTPEWFLGNVISDKCDIYSYGKVLLDLFFGQRYVCLDQNGDDIYVKGGNSGLEQRTFHAFMREKLPEKNLVL
ncbi:hypothetical protein GIB67_029076 [Kingdonia uniflora]|uniref:Uncharacterized protein n=1 Tax=Kingdonia uniflora TaxID=39325 RepID=A0A7J7N6P0_9MAGN|nr:hypothetical protein GIB67_029076 [Kingdonia uniflora]